MEINDCNFFLQIIFILLAISTSAFAQGSAVTPSTTTANARDELIRAFQSESKIGTHIFYTQAYKAHGRRVEFNGSIFGEIQDLQVDGCELKLQSRLVDLYTGSVGNGPTGRTQSKYMSSIEFKLTEKIASGLEVVSARPVRQLSIGTNALCSGDRKCMLTWIKLKTDSRVIHLTEFTDDVANYNGDVKDFDGAVNQFWLPVSSLEAGSQLVDKMREYARTCSK